MAGSGSETQAPCGGPNVYCPRGSGYPVKAASGRRTINGAVGTEEELTNANTRQAEVLCSPGYYCAKGHQIPCPLGTYGNNTGLRSPLCAGPCLSGTYCPPGSIVPTVCAIGHFCPDGQKEWKCPPGTYGSVTGLLDRTCSGLCQKGYYCLEGAVSSTNAECPSGRYGSINGLQHANCSGLCKEGYYCERASVAATHKKCGGHNHHCPEGSSLPTLTYKGYYSIGGASYLTRTSQTLCEPGHFCRWGEKLACPTGSYGTTYGLSVDYELRDGSSRAGTLPPTAAPTFFVSYSPTMNPTTMEPTTMIPSIALTAMPTAENITGNLTSDPTISPTFRPTDSMTSSDNPTPAPTNPNEILFATYTCSGLCPPGYYCPKNSSNPTAFPCPAGRYGASEGLVDASCTAETPLGHYSLAGAVGPTKCKAGYYGASTGLTDEHCSTDCWEGLCVPALCAAGYYCPEGSVQRDQYSCGGIDEYCPMGSGQPTHVTAGFYSIGPKIEEGVEGTPAYTQELAGLGELHRVDQTICERGSFCDAGRKSKCPAGKYGFSEGLVNSYCTGNCPVGHYCPAGTSNPISNRCPAGRYGSVTGIYNR